MVARRITIDDIPKYHKVLLADEFYIGTSKSLVLATEIVFDQAGTVTSSRFIVTDHKVIVYNQNNLEEAIRIYNMIG